ncbi:Dna2/Cas4 domain-containing protein [Candidatus Woesearchaeota archaeon]|nr:Dna2/Cas4 domain-containing protein [Candidatus Woesearchaeota archaeon]
MNEKSVVIGASWLQEASFCEQKLYLSKVKKLPLIETSAMTKGSLLHERKYENFVKLATPITWEEFFKSEEPVTSREIELQHISNDVILLGRIDELGCDKDGVYVIDDKPNNYAYIGVRKQIWAYCYLLENNFKELIKKPIYAVLKNRDNSSIIWKETYTGVHKEQLLLAILRLRDVLSEKRKPEPTKNPNKCTVCQYNKICEFSLAK